MRTIASLLFAASLASGARAAAPAPAAGCQTPAALESSLARDFPEGGRVSASFARLARGPQGAVSGGGLSERESAFLARVLPKTGIGPDEGLGMVAMAFAPPLGHTVKSFVAVDAAGCARILRDLKIIVRADGSVETVSPWVPRENLAP